MPAPTVLRIAHVEDHETMQIGFATIISSQTDLEIAVSASSVDELVALGVEVDLVVLDLRLSDGSDVTSNVSTLLDRGYRVLAFTAAEDPEVVRSASRAGVLGIVRKSEPAATVADAVRRAARGESIATTEWAAAVDADPELADASLSPKEQEVLALYASGEKSHAVATAAGLSPSTVTEYVRRIRVKYTLVGRPAHTKIDLYKRAVEDGVLPGPGA